MADKRNQLYQIAVDAAKDLGDKFKELSAPALAMLPDLMPKAKGNEFKLASGRVSRKVASAHGEGGESLEFEASTYGTGRGRNGDGFIQNRSLTSTEIPLKGHVIAKLPGKGCDKDAIKIGEVFTIKNTETGLVELAQVVDTGGARENNRCMDLNMPLAQKLGMINKNGVPGVADVKVEKNDAAAAVHYAAQIALGSKVQPPTALAEAVGEILKKMNEKAPDVVGAPAATPLLKASAAGKVMS